jgi:2-polyprenyl-3-methyl-5-hydroxy-6-metoxy-1,4-benzoquinol methylase
MNCPTCTAYCDTVFLDIFDDRYGYPKVFNLYQCNECRHKFLQHSFSSNDLEDLYTNYYPRSKFSIQDYTPLTFKNNFISWFDGDRRAHTYVPKNIRVLDIGCGFGESIGYHNARGCDAYGVEADANIQKIKDKFGLNIKVGLFNADDYEADFFDYVTLDQVLEHTVNPIEILCGVSKILKPNGRVVITIPNSNGWGAKLFGRRWINWHIPYHLQLFSKESIQLAADKTDFEIQTIKTVTTSEWLHYQWMSLISYPELGVKSIFWGGEARSVKKTSIRYIGFVFFTILHKLRVNHVITRLFDSISLGDCFIIILHKKH